MLGSRRRYRNRIERLSALVVHAEERIGQREDDGVAIAERLARAEAAMLAIADAEHARCDPQPPTFWCPCAKSGINETIRHYFAEAPAASPCEARLAA